MSDLLRQIIACCTGHSRPSKNSPMLEQYQKCEKAIDHQINQMNHLLNTDRTINQIKKKINPEIKEACAPWFSNIDDRKWTERGFDENGYGIEFNKNVNEYIKNNGYSDKYFVDHINVHIYPNKINDDNIIYVNKFSFEPKTEIDNPIFGINQEFCTKVNKDTNVIEMFRYELPYSDL